MALVFLSGAIDLADSNYQDWKTSVKEKLAEAKIGTVDPAGTFNYVINEDSDVEHRHTAEALININHHGLVNSDFALIVLDEKTPSIGTPIELYMCAIHSIPNVVVWNGTRRPAYVYGLADHVVTCFDQAIEIILEHFER